MGAGDPHAPPPERRGMTEGHQPNRDLRPIPEVRRLRPAPRPPDPIPSLSIGGIEDSLCINRASATGETRAGFEREAARWRAHLADVDDQLEIYAHAGAK